jgi:rhodanese-related sulfurtransferase
MLIDKGYTNVRPLAGGLDAWVDAGFPVEDLG